MLPCPEHRFRGNSRSKGLCTLVTIRALAGEETFKQKGWLLLRCLRAARKQTQTQSHGINFRQICAGRYITLGESKSRNSAGHSPLKFDNQSSIPEGNRGVLDIKI